MKGGCAAADPEFGNEMRPSTGAAGGACAESTDSVRTTSPPQKKRGTGEFYPRAPVARCQLPLEREAEGELHDPHEPGLNVRLTKGVAGRERVVALERAHRRPVEQVQHFEPDHRQLRAAQT